MAENNTNKAEFDGYKDVYEQDIESALSFSGKGHDFFTKVKAKRLIEILKDLGQGATAPLNVLDVGCGHGLIHPYLVSASDIKINLTGVDVAATVVEEARQKNPSVSYDTYEGDHLPYADNSFDLAFTICVMHHVPPKQWPSFLREIKRVLRPGGVLAVFEHNPLNPLTRHIVNTCPLDQNAVLLRKGKLESLISAEGYEQITGQNILFTPFDNATFEKLDHLLGWLPFGAQYYLTGQKP